LQRTKHIAVNLLRTRPSMQGGQNIVHKIVNSSLDIPSNLSEYKILEVSVGVFYARPNLQRYQLLCLKLRH